ncbi:MAG: Eco57I restriction-modification methylase domain-containing protein [Chitinophagales bacterium]|nr:Eco57I restriction-modification methylase domain-containing protein [Chitinophagales bacterium]
MALFQKSILNQYLKELDKTKVANAYALFKAHFHNAVIQQHIRESKEEQYQGEFLIDLFVNVLGYTKNPQPNFNLQTEQKNETDSKKADGAILKGGNVIAVIELKGTNTTDLNTVTSQAFGYKNNQKNCKYVLISNFEKLRFYIDNAIDFEEFNLFALTENEFALLYLCLQCENLLSDLPNKIKQASTVKEENITKQLYKDYSDLKRKLFSDIVHLNPQYDKLILFKKSQKLLDRILFILFAEDRNLIPANTIHTILSEFENLKKLDAYQPLYERFKKHFHYLNVGFKNDVYEVYGYNGGLFADDEILDSIKISDNLLQNYVPILSKYDYETDVDVNILGHIFEHSLNDIEEIQAKLDGKEIDKTKTKRKKDGVFYTPKYITKYIVENAVGALCTEKRNEYGIVADNYTPDKRKAKKKELLEKLDTYQNWLLEITIVDPACGSGAFLNQALDFLILEHKSIDELRAQLLGHSFVLPDHEIEILENNIFGVDLNEESVEIARLSLWLRTARTGRKLNSLNNNIKCGNSLIDDKAIAGEKAFNWQTEFPAIFEKGGFDVVIGNPPYLVIKGGRWLGGFEYTNEAILFIREKYTTAEQQINTYNLFFELCSSISKKDAFISLITPNTFLTNEYSKKLRQLFLEKTTVLDLNNVGIVFEDAGVEAIIVTFKNFYTENNITKITTQIQSTSINILDFKNFTTDFKFLLELNEDDISVIKKLNKADKLNKYSKVWRGLTTGNDAKYLSNKPTDIFHKNLITGKDTHRYFLDNTELFVLYKKDELDRARDERIFLLNEKLVSKFVGTKLTFAYDNEQKYVLNSCCVTEKLDNELNIKYILSLLNAKLTDYYFKKIFADNRDTFPIMKSGNIENLPFIKISLSEQQPFIEKAETMLQKNKELQTVKTNVIKLLQSQYATININTKLSNWNELSFKDFIKELEKQKIKLIISEKAELMQYFEAEQTKANNIQQIINQTDKEIDQMVYKLYELTDEEIKIVENN